MNVESWLAGIEPTSSRYAYALPGLPRPNCGRPTRRSTRRRGQMPTPTSSTGSPPPKRPRPTVDEDSVDPDNDAPPKTFEHMPDLDRTPRGSRTTTTWSHSEGSTSRSSGSRSPTKRLAALELASRPVVVNQIQRADRRMPAALRLMLDQLDRFQSRIGVVPGYLAREIEALAVDEGDYQYHFFNFEPHTFQPVGAMSVDPDISIDRVMEVFFAATECFNERHPEPTWNSHVHGPVFQLALGSILDKDSAAQPPDCADGSQKPDASTRVRAMPCTTARLIRHPHGAKMVDFCIFIDPRGEDAEKVQQIRTRLGHGHVNHTDFYPLRQRPLVLSAESKRPGEDYQNAQVQLGVWQAAQWALLEQLSRARSEALISFLPALIIQGHEWSFAATTKSGPQTVLWVKQPIGATDTVLGIFQIICALRHIASWARDTYWPWYRDEILGAAAL
ncbi:hypothetical protein GGR57DRAFT_263951 [Xylariaceae sp. FL1272]|nr:hypothetical protein GGR57DRAFT_263951 [Xylariaceae sp. FL1272]